MATIWTKARRKAQSKRMKALQKSRRINVHTSRERGPGVDQPKARVIPPPTPPTWSNIGGDGQQVGAVRAAYLSGVQDGVRLGWDNALVHRP
jgi:hypothetical protein